MNLQLSLKTKWFEMTKSGIKKEDYREINSYWITRLTKEFSWDMSKYTLKLNEFKDVLNKGSLNQVILSKHNDSRLSKVNRY